MKYLETNDAWKEYLNAHDAELLDVHIGLGLNSTRVTLRCRQCGAEETDIRAANLVRRKRLCIACNGREDYSTEGIRDLINSNGGIYLAGEVITRDSLIRHNCPGCQREVEKRAQDIRRSPKSCIHCRPDRVKQTALQNRDNLVRAHQIAEKRGGRCLTEDGLVSMKDKLFFECSLGHRWESSLNSVETQDTWCPQCASSRSERTVRALFEAVYEADFPQTRPEFLKATRCHLDGYNQHLGLAFEFNGRQHYELNAMFHRSDQDLSNQRDRDRNKAQLCKDNGVTLITVPYWILNQGMGKIRELISSTLSDCGVPPIFDPMQAQIDPRKIYDAREDSAFQQFHDIVAKNGGHFEPSDYLGRTVKLPVTCTEGHTWDARPDLVIRGHWCPVCSGNQALNFDAIQKQLQEADWSLDEVNEAYQKASQKLRLRCPRGHLVVRSWNRWKTQQATGEPTCEQCVQEDRAQEFVDKMLQRGFRMDVDLSTYQGEGQSVRGICTHCAQETTLFVQSWKNRALAPCCSRSLPAYHRCHCKSANELPA